VLLQVGRNAEVFTSLADSLPKVSINTYLHLIHPSVQQRRLSISQASPENSRQEAQGGCVSESGAKGNPIEKPSFISSVENS
jgi:hypothetical protein